MTFEALLGRACSDPQFRADLVENGATAATSLGASSLSEGQRRFFNHFKTNPGDVEETLKKLDSLIRVDSLVRVFCPGAPKC